MRKRIITQAEESTAPDGAQWLDLERLAQVEISSEAPDSPIESALGRQAGSGWRAAQPGEQAIRLLFDEPVRLRRVHLAFREEERPRTQEMVLRWRRSGEDFFRDVVRQQYHFSPPGTTREIEDYTIELDQVAALELRIVPEIGGGDALASLARLRLA